MNIPRITAMLMMSAWNLYSSAHTNGVTEGAEQLVLRQCVEKSRAFQGQARQVA